MNEGVERGNYNASIHVYLLADKHPVYNEGPEAIS